MYTMERGGSRQQKLLLLNRDVIWADHVSPTLSVENHIHPTYLQVSRGAELTFLGAKHLSQKSSSSGFSCLHCLHRHWNGDIGAAVCA